MSLAFLREAGVGLKAEVRCPRRRQRRKAVQLQRWLHRRLTNLSTVQLAQPGGSPATEQARDCRHHEQVQAKGLGVLPRTLGKLAAEVAGLFGLIPHGARSARVVR